MQIRTLARFSGPRPVRMEPLAIAGENRRHALEPQGAMSLPHCTKVLKSPAYPLLGHTVEGVQYCWSITTANIVSPLAEAIASEEGCALRRIRQ